MRWILPCLIRCARLSPTCAKYNRLPLVATAVKVAPRPRCAWLVCPSVWMIELASSTAIRRRSAKGCFP